MNVLIDVGNSRIKWKIDSCEINNNLNIVSYNEDTLSAQLDRSLNMPGERIDNVYISNVAGKKIKSKLIQWFADRHNVVPEFAESCLEMCGLISAYKQPEQLGVDRFLAMLGAQLEGREAKVVVDCGTATTIDCISPQSEFIGGLIIPGLGLMQASLSEKSEALAVMSVDEGVTFFSTDTISAISSGTILATTSVIENAVKTLSETSGSDVKCVITGGDGQIIQTYLQIDSHYQEDLVLKGLSVYFQAK